jgi:hypothetical protein
MLYANVYFIYYSNRWEPERERKCGREKE